MKRTGDTQAYVLQSKRGFLHLGSKEFVNVSVRNCAVEPVATHPFGHGNHEIQVDTKFVADLSLLFHYAVMREESHILQRDGDAITHHRCISRVFCRYGADDGHLRRVCSDKRQR